MSRLKHQLIATSTFLCLAPTAFADVTADDIWNDWKSYITSFGYQISGDETRRPNSLVVTNLLMSSTAEPGTGTASMSMDRVTFTEGSDGTVSIELPAIMPFDFSALDESGSTISVMMNYQQSGLNIVASGTPSALRYDYQAENITLETTGMEVDGERLPDDPNNIKIAFDHMNGNTKMALDSMRRYTQQLAVDSVNYEFGFEDPDTGDTVAFTGQAKELVIASTSDLPLRVVQATDIDTMLAAGFSLDGELSYKAFAAEMLAASPGQNVSGVATIDTGTAQLKMGPSGFDYSGVQTGVSAQMTSDMFPFPLDFSVAEYGSNFAMPLRKSDTYDNFSLGFEISGFSMSDILWGLFDPTAQLPRDPATIAIDLTGKGRLLFNFLDPNAAVVSGDANITPAEIEALDINKLQVTVAGAELTGDGAFQFNNSAGGAPKPSGAVNLNLVGGNGLLNKLVAIGLLPEDQAMGARMMLGLLAIPGEAPDTLKSKIEINEQGHISANGQRFQ